MLEKLTLKDVDDRKNWEEIFEIMKQQGAVGITQTLDYRDALWYKNNLEKFKEKTSPEGSIVDLYDDIIFDFDGVLYDSTKAVYEAAKLAIENFAKGCVHPNLSVPEIANSFHSPFNEYYARFGIDFNDPKTKKAFYNYYQNFCYPQAKNNHPPRFYDDALKMLEVLRQAKLKNPNLKVHLVSANKGDYLREKLGEIGALDIFTEMHFNAGDKKETIGEIASKSNNRERCIMIGDLPSDIKDAQANIGVKSVAVVRGEREQERLGHYLPDYIVPNLDKIFDLKSYAKELREQK